MAGRLDKWEAQHRRNVERYARMIDDIYKEAVREAASLSIPLTGIFNPDKPFSFADYPLTRNRINNLLESLKNGIEVAIVNGVRSEWTLAGDKNNELCRRVFGDNVGKLTDEQYKRYYSNNDKARDAFLARKEAGLNLSDRVWNYTDQFREEIEMGLDLGLRDGLSADEMSRTLRQYMKYPDKLFRRVRDEHGNLHLSKRAAAFHPGRGVYRSSYKNARRLSATETNMAYRTADYVRHQQLDFIVGIEIHLSGNHPVTDICDDLQGKYPKDFKFTGWHPLCRCYTTTVLKTAEEMAEDNRRIMEGEEPMRAEESRNFVPDVPDKFKGWIDDNTERIERAKSLPYFMRDNEKYIKPLTITPQARAGADEAQKFNAEMMRAADVPQAKRPRTREEILAAAQERHAARTQEEIDGIYERLAKRDIGVALKRTPLKFKDPNNITDEDMKDVIKAFAKNNPDLFRGGLVNVEIKRANDVTSFMSTERSYYEMNGRYVYLGSGNTVTITDRQLLGGTFNPFAELRGALKAISQGKDMTFNQEYALESLWHEVRHAQAVGFKDAKLKDDYTTGAMETINQFCARHSYGHFVRSLGGKARYTDDVIKSGYGYSDLVSNFQKLLKNMNMTQAEAYTHFKDMILKTPYEDIYGEIVKYIQDKGRYKELAAKLITRSIVEMSPEKFTALLNILKLNY